MIRVYGQQAGRFLWKALFDTKTARTIGQNSGKDSVPKKEPMRILVIRLDLIGDMIWMSPFLRELRDNFPKAVITLVVAPGTYNLVELCPYVDHVMVYKRSRRPFFPIRILKAMLFCKTLWPVPPQWAIVPRFDADDEMLAGMVALLSGAGRRIGYPSDCTEYKRMVDYGYDDFYTDLVPSAKGGRHEVQRNLDILRYLHCAVRDDSLEVWINNQDTSVAQSLLEKSIDTISCNHESTIRIAVFLSTSSRKREWDVENFGIVLEKISSLVDCQWILLGAKSNTAEYGARLLASHPNLPIKNLIGMTSLRETIAVLQRCDAYFGGDTGPVHMAAALHIPGVCLSCHPKGGRADHECAPERVSPYKADNIQILRPDPLPGCRDACQSSKAHCINQISVEEVCNSLAACLQHIREQRSI